jgi:hypothetical protein
LILNKPYFISLAGNVRQLADDLLKNKAIWIDKNGIIHSTINGSRMLKRYKKKFQKRKREEEREANGTSDRPNLRRHCSEKKRADGQGRPR